jgi:hypothetical protein
LSILAIRSSRCIAFSNASAYFNVTLLHVHVQAPEQARPLWAAVEITSPERVVVRGRVHGVEGLKLPAGMLGVVELVDLAGARVQSFSTR